MASMAPEGLQWGFPVIGASSVIRADRCHLASKSQHVTCLPTSEKRGKTVPIDRQCRPLFALSGLCSVD